MKTESQEQLTKIKLQQDLIFRIMKLKVIGTGSKGNAYLLENEQEALLIECGVNIMDIKKAVNFNISKIAGCIVTHEHNDHAKSIKEVLGASIKVFATKGTFDAKGIDSAYWAKAHDVWNGHEFKVGNFKILVFKINHDAAEPVGYLINHKETGNVLFLTDTYYSNYTFSDLHNIIIEANYSEEIINNKLTDKKFLRDRIFTSHMSIETCCQFLQANDLTQVNNIVLIHLSDSNSNEIEFGKRVCNETGKEVHVANNGMMINLNKTPF